MMLLQGADIFRLRGQILMNCKGNNIIREESIYSASSDTRTVAKKALKSLERLVGCGQRGRAHGGDRLVGPAESV